MPDVPGVFHARVATYLAGGTDTEAISTLEEQDMSTELASLTASAALADDVVTSGCFLSYPAKSVCVEDWTMGDLVEIVEEK